MFEFLHFAEREVCGRELENTVTELRACQCCGTPGVVCTRQNLAFMPLILQDLLGGTSEYDIESALRARAAVLPLHVVPYLTVGRSERADIVVPQTECKTVSRMHGAFTMDSRHVIRYLDFKTINKTKVVVPRLGHTFVRTFPLVLEDGMSLTLGHKLDTANNYGATFLYRAEKPKLASIPEVLVAANGTERDGLEQCSMQDTLQCGICFDVLKSAHAMTACGHSFCGNCIAQWLLRGTTTCPTCRTVSDVSAPIAPVLALDELVMQLATMSADAALRAAVHEYRSHTRIINESKKIVAAEGAPVRVHHVECGAKRGAPPDVTGRRVVQRF